MDSVVVIVYPRLISGDIFWYGYTLVPYEPEKKVLCNLLVQSEIGFLSVLARPWWNDVKSGRFYKLRIHSAKQVSFALRSEHFFGSLMLRFALLEFGDGPLIIRYVHLPFEDLWLDERPCVHFCNYWAVLIGAEPPATYRLASCLSLAQFVSHMVLQFQSCSHPDQTCPDASRVMPRTNVKLEGEVFAREVFRGGLIWLNDERSCL